MHRCLAVLVSVLHINKSDHTNGIAMRGLIVFPKDQGILAALKQEQQQ